MTEVRSITEVTALIAQRKMQSELAYMSLQWASGNDSCGRLRSRVVQLSASLSSSKSGLTETSNQSNSGTRNACMAASVHPLKSSEPESIPTLDGKTLNPGTLLLSLPLELRLKIIEYIVHTEGLPEIRYHKSTRSDLTRPHPLNKTCQQLNYEFNKIQREKAIHVIHHVFGYGDANSTNKRYSDTTFGALDHIRHVRIVAEFTTSFQPMNAIGTSTIDIITSECTRFPRAKNVCVELRMSASTLPFYGTHAPNTDATELIFILGIQSHLPSVFLPGPAPMEDWLADIVKQFPNVRKVSLTWEGLKWREGYVKAVEEKLLRDSLEGMCKEGVEITTTLKQLW